MIGCLLQISPAKAAKNIKTNLHTWYDTVVQQNIYPAAAAVLVVRGKQHW